jgi:hypothetical protein
LLRLMEGAEEGEPLLQVISSRFIRRQSIGSSSSNMREG